MGLAWYSGSKAKPVLTLISSPLPEFPPLANAWSYNEIELCESLRTDLYRTLS